VSVRTARVEEICDINPRMPKSLDDNDIGSFLSMAAVSEEGRINFEEERPVGTVKKGYTYFERGDVLVAKITPCFENGKATRTANLIHPFGFGSTEFHVLRAANDVSPDYLFYRIWNSSFRALGANNMTGSAGQKRVPVDFLRRLEISLPPLDEQRRIAAVLDKADVLRRKRKRALDLLDGLTRSIFLEMFGNPESNLKGWAVHPFHEVVDIDAPLVDPKLPEYKRILHYGPDRIEKNTGRLLPALTAEKDGLISNKFLCNESHILYSKIRPYLNKVALSEGVCLCSADVYPVSAKPEVVDRLYLWHLLRSKAFLKFSESHSSRANIPKINRQQFLGFVAPIPPLALQREFAQRINLSRLTAKRSAFGNMLTDSLFSSLQARAFSGQL
jgi:type I restriction enzyme S subunit